MDFKEEEIRPKKLIDQSKKYFNYDVNFLKKNTKYFYHSNCPACNSKNKKFLFKKNSFKYYNCTKCETIYINPRPSEKLLEKFYKNSKLYEYWNNYIFPASDKVRKNKVFKPRVNEIIKLCKKYNIKNNSIMDIGAGFGTFCQAMLERKYFKNVYALEPNKSGAKRCMEKNIKTFDTTLNKLEPKLLSKINVFTSFEVIEHTSKPYKFLKDISKYLKKNSLLIFTCPNGQGFDLNILGKKADTFDHEHVTYLNPFSAKILTEKCGFDVMEILTPGNMDLDIIFNKYRYKKFSTKNRFILQLMKNSNLRENLQKFLKENNLSSHMWVVAKKR